MQPWRNLSKAEEAKLVLRMKSGDIEARNFLVMQCDKIAWKTARSYSEILCADKDDLYQHLIEKLLERCHVVDYRSDEEYRFHNFAKTFCINQLISLYAEIKRKTKVLCFTDIETTETRPDFEYIRRKSFLEALDKVREAYKTLGPHDRNAFCRVFKMPEIKPYSFYEVRRRVPLDQRKTFARDYNRAVNRIRIYLSENYPEFPFDFLELTPKGCKDLPLVFHPWKPKFSFQKRSHEAKNNQ